MNTYEVGMRIKQQRKSKKMTQQQLGDTIGKAEVTIRQYEKGLIEIPTSVLQKIADTLEISLSSLMGIQNESEEDRHNKSLQFNKMLITMGYSLQRDDPEHKPFLYTPDGSVYILSNDDLRKLQNSTEAFINYTIQDILKDCKKVK